MLTIGEYAMRAMVYAYRDMRSAHILPTGSLPGGYRVLTIAENEILRERITIQVATMANATPGFAWHLVPLIESLAFAIAMTEQYPIGSDRYCAWQAYEKELHMRAIDANR